jgi:PilZ domain
VQLSKELFAEITGIVPGTSTHCPAQDDRRSHPRIPFDHRARIYPLMEGVGECGAVVLIRDISVGGVGFLNAQEIAVGDEFVIRLFTPAEQPIDIQCTARRCEMGGTCGSQYVVGATFELVLNRPISSSVAPESELVADHEPLVDQPAALSIEQRYDHQCSVTRQIRPTVRQTRWDRLMAKPAVRRVMGILSHSFWPVLLLCRVIGSVLRAGEESRIRHRLTPNKSGKNGRMKKRPAAVVLPPVVEVAPPRVTTTTAAETPVAPRSGRSSLFATVEPAAMAPPLETPVVLPPSPAPASIAPVEPIGQVQPAAKPELTVTPAPPPSAEVQVTVYPQPATQPTPEPAQPAPTEKLNSQHNVPSESPVPQSVATSSPVIESAPSTPEIDPMRKTPMSSQTRPPVAHPRQVRRRARPSFHR